MYITAQGPRLQNDLYCVEWDVKPYYTLPCHTILLAPLTAALSNKRARCCRCAELLLQAGANPDAGDRWCMTPLMYAVQTEWFDMAELMIESGASVDLQDSRGRTPLTLAVDCSEDVCVHSGTFLEKRNQGVARNN